MPSSYPTTMRHNFADAFPPQDTSVAEYPDVLQRRINVEKLLEDPQKREFLFSHQIGVDDLEEVQELLEDADAVRHYLAKLELGMNRFFKTKESGKKYTSALDMALFELEKRWMDVPIDSEESTSKSARETIKSTSGTEKTEPFLEHIRTAKPLKDAGAPISHGEYTHRIQWYVIASDFLAGGLVSPGWIRALYRVLGDEKFIQKIDAYKEPDKFDWTLWGAVVDVPYSAAKSQTSGIGEVGFSAPVALNKEISESQGELEFSQLRLAVLNRRLKRFYEGIALKLKGRSDLAFKATLEGLPETVRHNQKFDDVAEDLVSLLTNAAANVKEGQIPDYDARNAIAFALAGIPPSPSYVQSAKFEPAKQNK